MNPNITFRPPQPEDLEALYAYAKEIEAEDTFITLHPGDPVTREEEEKYFQDLLKKIEKKEHVSLYVLDGKKIIGSAGIDKGGKRKTHVGRLGIALLKEYRGMGIGRELLQKIIDLAKQELGISIIFLEHFANNPRARALYEKFGFREIGVFPKAVFYKGEYVDEPIMVLELSWN